MEKQTQISYLLFGLYVLSKFLHNPIYSIFSQADYNKVKIFVLIFNFVFVLFVISILFNVITYVKKGEPKDLWKLGWIGFLGLLGLFFIPGVSAVSSLLGFFGLRKS